MILKLKHPQLNKYEIKRLWLISKFTTINHIEIGEDCCVLAHLINDDYIDITYDPSEKTMVRYMIFFTGKGINRKSNRLKDILTLIKR